MFDKTYTHVCIHNVYIYTFECSKEYLRIVFDVSNHA